MILIYTLKNTSYPEYIYHTDSGVMCLDIHKTQPYLVCVGFYDGSVAVFNVVTGRKEPLHRSTAKTGKHTDPVWQVSTPIFNIHLLEVDIFKAIITYLF